MPTECPPAPCGRALLVLLLVITSADAFTAAEEGRAALGYALLLRAQAQAIEVRAAGKPWARTLAAYWRKAETHYLARYGVHWE
jgi:hypothetical protein